MLALQRAIGAQAAVPPYHAAPTLPEMLRLCPERGCVETPRFPCRGARSLDPMPRRRVEAGLAREGRMTDVDRAAFAPLPGRGDRRTGVEIELGGLEVEAAAEVAARALGGRPEPDGPLAVVLRGSRLGDLKIYRDTAYRVAAVGTRIGRGLLAAAGDAVPLEIVAPPLTRERLAELDGLREALRQAGARGSRDGVLLGYGVHLNVEIEAPTASHLGRVLTAYALAEPGLRALHPIDATRRLMPFVEPYPKRLLDRLAAEAPDTAEGLAHLYLDETASRNHGLDLLPVLAHLVPEIVEARLPRDVKVNPRPAYHFRLPDCRIDEAGWRLAAEWGRWVAVERLAADAARLERLRQDWRAHRSGEAPGVWAGHAARVLAALEATA